MLCPDHCLEEGPSLGFFWFLKTYCIDRLCFKEIPTGISQIHSSSKGCKVLEDRRVYIAFYEALWWWAPDCVHCGCWTGLVRMMSWINMLPLGILLHGQWESLGWMSLLLLPKFCVSSLPNGPNPTLIIARKSGLDSCKRLKINKSFETLDLPFPILPQN